MQLKPVRLADYLLMHFIVFLWGFTSILGQLIHVGTLQLVFMRVGVASIVLWLFIWFKRKGQSGLPDVPLSKLSAKDKINLLGCGVVIGLHWLTFFGAARLANISTCLAGIATASLFTAILEPLAHKRRINYTELSLGLLVLIGLLIVFISDFDRAAGLLVAIISAALAAWFSILNSLLVRRFSTNHITTYTLTGATIFTGLALLVGNLAWPTAADIKWVMPSWSDWGYLLVLSLACTVFAYRASVHLMRRFTPFAMNLIINLEPVYGIILAYLIFGAAEKMSLQFYLGTVVIMLAVFSYPWLQRLTAPKVNLVTDASQEGQLAQDAKTS